MQGGIFRTNCIDCLDRTNVTQTKISMKTVEEILQYIKENHMGKQQKNAYVEPIVHQ